MAKPMFVVNGQEYPMPDELTLGEMCDAERFFGVEFGNNASSGVRMATALLWIAIHREDSTVTVEDIRALPPEVFEAVGKGDVLPPAESANASETNGSSERSGASSRNGGDNQAVSLEAIGPPR